MAPLAGGLIFPLGGDPPATRGASWWGPWFPDAGGRSTWWGPWFPDGAPNPNLVPGVGPAGAATFALDLQSGATMTLSWLTDIFKAYDGRERRISRLDLPKRKISGNAFLVGGAMARSTRARMARYAASGSPFLLGLPFDELTMSADADETDVHVSTTTLVDWGVQGQRVIVQNGDDFANAVTQVVSSNSITLDVDPAELGASGCRIMPAVAVFFDPQQGFSRYPTDPDDDVEKWAVSCSIIPFGYEQNVRQASASLSGSTGALKQATILYVNYSSAGNEYSIQFVGDSGSADGSISISGHAYTFHFLPGATTVAIMMAALVSIFDFSGTFLPTDFLVAGDEVGPLQLSLGADKIWGAMGTGATLATFAGRPLWDREILVDQVAGDSVHAMTEIVDMGGVLANIGSTLQPDWGRAVLARADLGIEWQWLKLFLFTVRGRARAFWLATWRNDLQAISFDTGELLISGPSFDTGDFFGWYPLQRTTLQILQEDGTVTCCAIADATDNGDGTIALTVNDEDGDPIDFVDSDITMVSWLELCHFESDDFQVKFSGSQFELNTQARVVQQ